MTSTQSYVVLNTGARMPAIGLGCWGGRLGGLTEEENEAVRPWIASALETGYRHFDTALDYGTELAIGKAIRESGISREEIFITTKLPVYRHTMVSASIEESLKNLGFEYYDLWLMHWPQAMASMDGKPYPRYSGSSGESDQNQGHFIMDDDRTFNQTWAEMENVFATGKVKAIGVSNFSVKNLRKLLETAKVIPAVNQVEMHPHQAQPELMEFCKEKGIVLTAYSPTGHSGVANDPAMIQIAGKYAVGPAQISLAWHLARGTSAVPQSKDAARQRANLLELPTLSNEDVELINTLHKDARYCWYPKPTERAGEKLVLGWTYEQLGW